MKDRGYEAYVPLVRQKVDSVATVSDRRKLRRSDSAAYKEIRGEPN